MILKRPNKKHNLIDPVHSKWEFCFAYLPNPAGQSKWAEKRGGRGSGSLQALSGAPLVTELPAAATPIHARDRLFGSTRIINVRHNSNKNPCVEEFDGSIILRGPHGVNKQKKDVEFHMYIS